MDNIVTISSDRDEDVFIRINMGHFITANAHINCYVGTSDIKHNHKTSVDAAMLLAQYYVQHDIHVDTVLCLYETQALGAYLAHELARPTMLAPNPDLDIFVLGPEYDATGNIIFRDNLVRMIQGKKVLVLISCITSGKTVERAIESIGYYGGEAVGVSAIFSATKEICGLEVNAIFTEDDVPGYSDYSSPDCPLCKQGVPVKAIANGYGYSKI